MKRSLALAKRNGIYTMAIKRALTSCLSLACILAFPALSMAGGKAYTKKVKVLSGHTGDITSVVFHPKGKFLASASRDFSVKLWHLNTGKVLRTIKTAKIIFALAINPKGSILAGASYDRTVKLWNAKTGVLLKTLKGHKKAINTLAFSADGKLLAAGDSKKTIILWGR